MRKCLIAWTCALIITGPNALAKDSCVEILAGGALLASPPRNERTRDTRIIQLLKGFFASQPLSPLLTGRIELLPADGKITVASDEFDELILKPFAEKLSGQTEMIKLLVDQASTKVKKAVFVTVHEGRAADIQFFDPRERTPQPFTASQYSGEVRAVPMNSEAGLKLLREARLAGFSDEAIVQYYQPQSFTTFCGIASSCMVLSSMRAIPLSQDTLMRWNRHIKPEAVVKAQIGEDPGFQMDQLLRVLNSRNERAVARYAVYDQVEGTNTLRAAITRGLRDQNEKVIVNFHGLTLGTLTGGHYSPVAAFDPAMDMALILDTAAHKNEPFWIPLADLYFAMTKLDAGSGRPRGWMEVSRTVRRSASTIN